MTEANNKFDWSELEVLSQKQRIDRLKQRAEELSGGEMTSWENQQAPPEILEQYWRNVVLYEEDQQGPKGVSVPAVQFPDPESLSEEELGQVLWKKIEELAERGIYFGQTDHLSDRELYEYMCRSDVRETAARPRLPGEFFHYDILGGYSQEDIELYLRYYADEDEREFWEEDWPRDKMPPKEDPPYDRDSKLPRPAGW